jgi:hypothetical protein
MWHLRQTMSVFRLRAVIFCEQSDFSGLPLTSKSANLRMGWSSISPVAGLIRLVGKVIWNAVIVLIRAGLVVVGYKANQPMAMAEAPKGMTYGLSWRTISFSMSFWPGPGFRPPYISTHWKHHFYL